jgi:hypothetical protein
MCSRAQVASSTGNSRRLYQEFGICESLHLDRGVRSSRGSILMPDRLPEHFSQRRKTKAYARPASRVSLCFPFRHLAGSTSVSESGCDDPDCRSSSVRARRSAVRRRGRRHIGTSTRAAGRLRTIRCGPAGGSDSAGTESEPSSFARCRAHSHAARNCRRNLALQPVVDFFKRSV